MFIVKIKNRPSDWEMTKLDIAYIREYQLE